MNVVLSKSLRGKSLVMTLARAHSYNVAQALVTGCARSSVSKTGLRGAFQGKISPATPGF